jgi:4-amino-4-deoxy-L-arabinose transferase-like glycosyltransferase
MKTPRLASWLQDEWRWLVAVILLAHFVLAVLYSVVTPIFEGPDELGHYRHIRFLIANLSLPAPEDSTSSLDELTHPPLYYALAAILTSWIDASDNPQPVRNPFAPTGTMEGGANRFVHTETEAFPYHGTALAVHAVRLVSVLIGSLVLVVTYWLGRLLFPGRREIALGAMALNAFSPAFLFMSSVVNNDIMVTLFSALTLLFSVKVVVRGPALKDLAAVGVFTGLALLSKYNALALMPVVLTCIGIALARLEKRRRSLVLLLGGVILLLVSAALISSWWFLRSVALFGTATTRSAKILAQFMSDLRDPLAGLSRVDWSLLPDGLRYFYTSFWASFGWGNISAATWVYQVLALLCLAGIAGLVIFFLGKASRPTKAGAALLLLAFVVFSLLAIYRTLVISDPVLRGRYALPTISAVSVLLSLGVVQVTPRRLARLPILVCGWAMLVLGVLAPFLFIAPAYARPPIVSVDETALVANRLEFNFGGKIELLGYELGVERGTVGDFVPITLYWRCLAATRRNYTVGLSILGPDDEPYGQVAAFPGHGNYPTSLWKKGQIIKDTYHVRVAPGFPAPSLARFYVALYVYPKEEYLPLVDSQGAQPSRAATFGQVPIDHGRPPAYTPTKSVQYDLAEHISLLGYDLDDRLFTTGCGCLTLYWESQGGLTEDYTVFVHVVDEEGQTVAQSDSMPRGGFYPTSYWLEGEAIADEHCLRFRNNVRPGSYRVLTGMYLLQTMHRLAAFDAAGNPVLNDQCLLLEASATTSSGRSHLPLALR